VKVAKLRYCLASRFGLVAVFIMRVLYNSDNNIVSIELEILGALFLPVGITFLCRYKFRSSCHDSRSSRSCLAQFGDYLHCRDLWCCCLWPVHLHILWQCSSLIAIASEIVFWYVYNMQNLHFNKLMTYNLFVYAVRNGKNLLDDWFVHFILPHVPTFCSSSCTISDTDNFMSIVPRLSVDWGGG
jgi:hypothetical protein